MKLNELHAKVIAVAKNNPPSDKVPYAFEKRIMSRLNALVPVSPWAVWGGPMWRAAASCVAITILCGVWSVAAERRADTPESFSQAFEAAVLTPPAQHTEDAW